MTSYVDYAAQLLLLRNNRLSNFGPSSTLIALTLGTRKRELQYRFPMPGDNNLLPVFYPDQFRQPVFASAMETRIPGADIGI